MTISSALNAGVMGLSVQGTRLSTISDNIANSATHGYKRADVDFASMVINQTRNVYAAGGVRAVTYKDITVPGSLVSTGSAMDIAVTGDGMIPVTDVFGVSEDPARREFMMVPTGSFEADEHGYLRTHSGLHLLGWAADENGVFGALSRDNVAELVPVNVNISQFSASATDSIRLGMNLPVGATEAGSSGEAYNLPIEYYDALGRAYNVIFEFSPVVPASGFSNEWNVSVTDMATDPDVPIADFGLIFSDDPASAGAISAVTPGAGATWDPDSGELSFDVLDNTISTFLGFINDNTDGMTQLDTSFSPYNITKTGAPIGNLNTVEIDDYGFLEAIYDTGFRRTIYKIPVASVPDPDGLTSRNDQAYSISPTSGGVYLWDAGDGPVGGYAGYVLMASNTDIASELTNLIETQRAYSSNAKIIQTVDEMLQETTNLKR